MKFLLLLLVIVTVAAAESIEDQEPRIPCCPNFNLDSGGMGDFYQVKKIQAYILVRKRKLVIRIQQLKIQRLIE